MDFNLDQESKFEWRKYLDMGIRHKWLIIIPAVMGLIIATVVAFSLPKLYEASTLILVENKQMLEPLVQGLAVSTNVRERLNILREEILSWPRLMQLVEKLELDQDIKSPSQYESLIKRLKGAIKVEMQKNQNVILISYEDTTPLNAQNVVRTISDILIERNVTSQSTEANDAIDFIERQLEEYQEKLEDSESELRKFQEVYTYSLPVAARVNQHVVDLEMQLNMLLVDNTEQHPAVIALRKQIAQLKGERKKELMKMETKGVDVNSKEFQEISYSVPRQQQELARLQRDTKVNAKLYEQLLQRLESARISKKLDSTEEGTRFKVIEPARLPLNPIKPDVPRIILIGFALGLAFGCGIAFLLEVSNSSFRSVEEAKGTLPLPILGSISKIEVNPKLVKELKKRIKKAARDARRKEKALSNQHSLKTLQPVDASGNRVLAYMKSIGKTLGLF